MLLIYNANIVNEGKVFGGYVLVKDGRILEVGTENHPDESLLSSKDIEAIDASGSFLIPGIIDDQVHFREPGLTHKGDIRSESRAAVAGGITSFMDMPNTVPQTTTIELLDSKFEIAARESLANYSFYMGATNDNMDEVRKVDPKKVCGVKVFMGASTGNMLVDNPATLEGIFRESPILVAIHSEYEPIIRENTEKFKQQYGDNVPFDCHPLIRSSDACLRSTEIAIGLATKFNSRLHILHLSTEAETKLLSRASLKEKRITAEVCVHHLWFDDSDYPALGSHIKWNPAIKSAADKQALWNALDDGRIDVIATDHAPHTLEEKNNTYFKAPSGGPLVQHSLLAMLECSLRGKISIENIVQKMCHNMAELFQIKARGYIRKGYYADLVLIEPGKETQVTKDTILYKCGWSPFEGTTFHQRITHTFVNGLLVYKHGVFISEEPGIALEFDR
jgi:dihydroorotase